MNRAGGQVWGRQEEVREEKVAFVHEGNGQGPS